MFKIKLKPTYFYSKIENINHQFLKKYDFIFFDLDNTLVIPETTKTLTSIQIWVDNLPKQKCLILSNSNSILIRKEQIEKKFGIKFFLSKWNKPIPFLCMEIQKKIKIKNKKVLFIGDHIMADIIFGNNCGFDTLLVKERFKDRKIKSFFENLLIKILKLKT